MNAKAEQAAELPRARAQVRYANLTPMKARPVAKLLASAVANAENNQGLDPASLIVDTIYVDEGPTLKRFQPRAQGRAFRIRKRTCHITIELVSIDADGGRSTGGRSNSAKGRTR